MDRRGERIVFPPFTLDVPSGRLLHGDRAIPLRPKTWAVLHYLATHPGDLIPAREILAAVWPATAVTDDTLGKSISEIRRALGDDARGPRFVARVHGRGFRFIAALEAPPSAAVATHVDGWWPDLGERLVVGRAGELRQLQRYFERARQGQRQLVFLEGEAGMGKTALVEEFLARAEASDGGTSLVVGQGSSIEQRGACEAYLPVLGALEQLARGRRGPEVARLLRRFAPTWLAQVPWLGHDEELGASPNALADGRAERMLREFCGFAEALSECHPVLIVLEDLHWSDPATIELLLLLAQRRGPARLMLVVTYRPSDASTPEHPLSVASQTLRPRRQCVEVRLRGLTTTDVASYLERRFDGAKFSDDIVRLLHSRTGGSPLFLVALLDDLMARGWVVETSPGWALAVPLARVSLHVPEDLRQLIGLQLMRLPPVDRAILAAASVAGMEFSIESLAVACGPGADDVEDACVRLSRAHRFLRRPVLDDAPHSDASGRYCFVHAIYRQVVYEEIPAGKRQRLHHAIGEALEARRAIAGADAVADLAFHFERSRDVTRALQYLVAAAKVMQSRFASRETLAYLERGFTLLPMLGDEATRCERELQLRDCLSWVLSTVDGYASASARQNFARMEELCEKTGSARDLYRALYALWHSQAAAADLKLPSTAARMAQIAATLEDPELQAQAAVVRGRTLFWQGRLSEAQQALGSVVTYWGRRPGTMEGPAVLEPPGIAVHCYSAAASGFLGQVAEGKAAVGEALAVARSVEDPFVQAGVHLHAAYLHHLWSDVDAVDAHAVKTLALTEEHGFPFWRGLATGLSGWVLLQRGEARRAAHEIREGIRLQFTSGARTVCAHFSAFLGAACLNLKDIAAGTEAVTAGLALVADGCDRIYEAELWRLKGELVLAQKRPRARVLHEDVAAAEECFHRAIAVAESMGAKIFEARAACSLARLWSAQGRATASRDVLLRACGSAGANSESPDVRSAVALLAELPKA